MVPQERNYQTVTQVKVLSPEIIQCVVAEGFHLSEGIKVNHNMVRGLLFNRGLSPQYDNESILRELGRSKYLSHKRIYINNLKRKEDVDGYLEVGWSHIKGVAEVIICEANESHLKGTTLLCRGRGKLNPYKEMD